MHVAYKFVNLIYINEFNQTMLAILALHCHTSTFALGRVILYILSVEYYFSTYNFMSIHKLLASSAKF